METPNHILSSSRHLKACTPLCFISITEPSNSTKMIQTKAIHATSKVNCNLVTKPGNRRCGKMNQTRTHFRHRPTIPLLIIQSNFGEELQVEAGLPSFMHRQRVHLEGKQLLRQRNIHIYSTLFLDWNSLTAVLLPKLSPPSKSNTAQTLCTIPWICIQWACYSVAYKTSEFDLWGLW